MKTSQFNCATALYLACQTGDTDAALALATAGASLNASAEFSAAEVAALYGHTLLSNRLQQLGSQLREETLLRFTFFTLSMNRKLAGSAEILVLRNMLFRLKATLETSKSSLVKYSPKFSLYDASPSAQALLHLDTQLFRFFVSLELGDLSTCRALLAKYTFEAAGHTDWLKKTAVGLKPSELFETVIRLTSQASAADAELFAIVVQLAKAGFDFKKAYSNAATKQRLLRTSPEFQQVFLCMFKLSQEHRLSFEQFDPQHPETAYPALESMAKTRQLTADTFLASLTPLKQPTFVANTDGFLQHFTGEQFIGPAFESLLLVDGPLVYGKVKGRYGVYNTLDPARKHVALGKDAVQQTVSARKRSLKSS